MSNSEDYLNPHSSNYIRKEQELLRKLMPELGMDASVPTGRYRRTARLKYLLPQVLLLLVVCALWCAAMWYFVLPARIVDIRTTEGPEGATVDFNVDRVLLLESVSATLDGQPVAVEWDTVGEYQVQLDKNGELSIVARTFTGRESKAETPITAVDTEPPHISKDELADGNIYIYLTDGSGTGVNWDSLHASDADSGEDIDIDVVDREAGFFGLAFPERSVRIYVEDVKGNDLAMLLEVVPGTAPAKEPEPAADVPDSGQTVQIEP